MRATIDAAGRIVVPKALREQLGFGAGTELELDAVDGRLVVACPSRVRAEYGPHAARFGPRDSDSLSADQVRTLTERERRDRRHQGGHRGALDRHEQHDGLVALEARARRRMLLTLDRRAQDTYRRLGVRFEPVAGP